MFNLYLPKIKINRCYRTKHQYFEKSETKQGGFMLFWSIVLFVAGVVALINNWISFGPALEQYSGYLYAFVFMGCSLGILAHLHRKRWEQDKKSKTQDKTKKEKKEPAVV